MANLYQVIGYSLIDAPFMSPFLVIHCIHS